MDTIMYIVGALIFITGAIITLTIDIQRFRRPWLYYPFIFFLWWGIPYKDRIVQDKFRLPED